MPVNASKWVGKTFSLYEVQHVYAWMEGLSPELSKKTGLISSLIEFSFFLHLKSVVLQAVLKD